MDPGFVCVSIRGRRAAQKLSPQAELGKRGRDGEQDGSERCTSLIQKGLVLLVLSLPSGRYMRSL